METKEKNSLITRRTSTSQQPVPIELGDRSSRTIASPKQKATKTAVGTGGAAANTGRKASKSMNAALLEDDFFSILHAHYYPSFVEAFLSKLICLSSWHLAKKNLFQHIGDLYSQVNKKLIISIRNFTCFKSGLN